MCVCKWGHAVCVLTIPDLNCGDCDTLGSAIWSYLLAIYLSFFGSDDPEDDTEEQLFW